MRREAMAFTRQTAEPAVSTAAIFFLFVNLIVTNILSLNECNAFIFAPHQTSRVTSVDRGTDSLIQHGSLIQHHQQQLNHYQRWPSQLYFLSPNSKYYHGKTFPIFMGDHSSATLFQLGDIVTVTEDVMKAGKNLRGLSGEVIETWEKCDVDPTCCCAEWVDEGLSVHVRFNVEDSEGNGLFANDTFIHYFAESELVKKKEEGGVSVNVGVSGEKDISNQKSSDAVVAFDGMSCKAFKLDKLNMGEQSKRIKAFEDSRERKE